MYQIVITEPAEQDLKKAVRYISDELQNLTAAISFIDDVKKVINSLSEMPRRNPLVRDNTLAESGFRLVSVNQYLVFYIVRENPDRVIIERILYGRRDWNSLL